MNKTELTTDESRLAWKLWEDLKNSTTTVQLHQAHLDFCQAPYNVQQALIKAEISIMRQGQARAAPVDNPFSAE